nr:MAG TPA: hypothetical protein [Bacteriophage sp.]
MSTTLSFVRYLISVPYDTIISVIRNYVNIFFLIFGYFFKFVLK